MTNRRSLLTLAALSLLVGLAFQGSAGLFDPSEGRYAEVAREMVVSGDFLHPTLEERPHWTKPPMAYWTAAAGIRLWGVSAWGARFVNALAFVLTTLGVACIGMRLWSRRVGFVSGLVYLSSPLPVMGAAVLTGDTILTLFEVWAVAAYASAFRAEDGRSARWWSRATWLFFGLGFLTKGPPALLPLLPVLLFHRWGRAGAARFRLLDAWGALIFLVSAFWWYALVCVQTPGLASYFLFDEVLKRNFTDHFQRNPKWYAPLVVYLPVLLLCLGAWLLPAARLARERFARRRRGRFCTWREPGAPALLMLLWIALPLTVLCLSKSRLPLYVLPLHAPIALACAAAFAERLSASTIRRVAVAAIATCLVLKAVAPQFNEAQNAELIWSAASEAGGEGARWILLEEQHRHGLQFYFQGALERATLGEREDWADTDVAAVARGLAGRQEQRPVVFIGDDDDAGALTRVLESEGVPFTRSEAHGRSLVVALPAGLVPDRRPESRQARHPS